MFPTFTVLKLSPKVILSNLGFQALSSMKNMYCISVTLLVLKLLKSKVVKLTQFANIKDIFSTIDVFQSFSTNSSKK